MEPHVTPVGLVFTVLCFVITGHLTTTMMIKRIRKVIEGQACLLSLAAYEVVAARSVYHPSFLLYSVYDLCAISGT